MLFHHPSYSTTKSFFTRPTQLTNLLSIQPLLNFFHNCYNHATNVNPCFLFDVINLLIFISICFFIYYSFPLPQYFLSFYHPQPHHHTNNHYIPPTITTIQASFSPCRSLPLQIPPLPPPPPTSPHFFQFVSFLSPLQSLHSTPPLPPPHSTPTPTPLHPHPHSTLTSTPPPSFIPPPNPALSPLHPHPTLTPPHPHRRHATRQRQLHVRS